jgi:hypothetical protein
MFKGTIPTNGDVRSSREGRQMPGINGRLEMRCVSRPVCFFFVTSTIPKNGDERSTGKRLMLEINGGSRRDAPDVFIIIIHYY